MLQYKHSICVFLTGCPQTCSHTCSVILPCAWSLRGTGDHALLSGNDSKMHCVVFTTHFPFYVGVYENQKQWTWQLCVRLRSTCQCFGFILYHAQSCDTQGDHSQVYTSETVCSASLRHILTIYCVLLLLTKTSGRVFFSLTDCREKEREQERESESPYYYPYYNNYILRNSTKSQ